MSVNNPRNRMLIFRVTHDEYNALQAASSEKGARSLSEFARAQLLKSLDAPALGNEITELKTMVARLTQIVQKEALPEREPLERN